MNTETAFELRIPINIGELDGYASPELILNQFTWQIETQKVVLSNGITGLGIFIRCTIKEPCPSDWSCIGTAMLRLESPRPTMESLEKQIYFMHFNPEHSKRGDDRFVHWNDLSRFVNATNKITLHVKIQAMGLSNANNLVNICTRTENERLEVNFTFNKIFTTNVMLSPEIRHDNGSAFRICIFKRPYASETEPNRKQDALWLYLCCRIGDNEHTKWSYKIKLLNEKLGPLCTKERKMRFSKFYDSDGAPFILLDDLYDRRNKYINNDAIVMQLDLMAMGDKSPKRIKSERLKREKSPELVLVPAINSRALGQAIALAQVKTEVSDDAPATEFPENYEIEPADIDVGDDNEDNNELRSPIPLNSKRKRAAEPVELLCVCAGNLLKVEAYTTKCGHVYCGDCIHNDIATRKMCMVCDGQLGKGHWYTQIYLTDEQRKKKRCLETRSVSSLRSFLDSFDENANKNSLDQTNSSDDGTATINASDLKCLVCEDYLLETEVFTTHCGHVFCKKCIYRDITGRGQCLVCNSKNQYDKWTQIYFTIQNGQPKSK